MQLSQQNMDEELSTLALLLKETPILEVEEELAKGLHMLAQYSLTVQTLRLSEAEVTALAGTPGTRRLLQEAAWSNSLSRLMSLHYFNQWLNTLGRENSAVLAVLSDSQLTTGLMASSMVLDETVLAQALDCAKGERSDKAMLSDWQIIYQVLQWVGVATALNTMPRLTSSPTFSLRESGEEFGCVRWAPKPSTSLMLNVLLKPRYVISMFRKNNVNLLLVKIVMRILRMTPSTGFAFKTR